MSTRDPGQREFRNPNTSSTSEYALNLFIEQNEDGIYSRVMDSPVGTAAAVFRSPVSTTEIEAFARAASSPYRPDTRQYEVARASARGIGERLFDATCAGAVGAVFHRCMDIAWQASTRLRIRLLLSETPEVMRLPWETLFNHMRDEFMSLSPHAPLSRYVELSHLIRPLRVQAPLRVLVVIAGPPGYPPVDTDREWISLVDTLDVLAARRELLVERLVHPSLFELQRRLRQQEYHVLHFVGHALYNSQAEESFLVLEDEQGRGRLVGGAHLGGILRDHFSLRLVVLNSTGAWQPLPREPFTHIAYSLVKRGLPMAIALPFELTDRAALAFHFDFYSRLAAGEAVDVAVAEARRAMLADVAGVEWCAPVLINRINDGRLFDILSHDSAEKNLGSSVAERYAAYKR